MDYKDYYKTLSLSRSASQEDVKKAFRRLARKYHPDVNPGDKTAEARFKEINEAYEVLSDPDKRHKYDTLGPNWQDQFSYGGPRPRPGSTTSTSSGRARTTAGGTSYDFADPTGFSDFFETLFGRAGARPGTAPGSRTSTPTFQQAGENIEQPVDVTLREAYTGTTRAFNVQASEPCAACGGTGRINGRPCVVCKGTGATSRSRRLEVAIPPGVDTGSRVTATGEGNPGFGGAPSGDLVLVVTVKPDPAFERRGDDLLTDVAVPLTTAVLGGEVPVRTLDGKRVRLTIPPETQNGQTFRLAGKGMPKAQGERHGNLLARVQVELPQRLNARQRELFEELASVRPDGDARTS